MILRRADPLLWPLEGDWARPLPGNLTFLGPNGTRFARCHFSTPKASIPLLALVIDVPASKSLRTVPYKQQVGYINRYYTWVCGVQMVAWLRAKGRVWGPLPLGHEALGTAQRFWDAHLQQIASLPGNLQYCSWMEPLDGCFNAGDFFACNLRVMIDIEGPLK